jgi:hypothetical protein
MSSDEFLMFERISGGTLGPRYDTYRVFLECMFDELALDLVVLFDRMTPQSAVFPILSIKRSSWLKPSLKLSNQLLNRVNMSWSAASVNSA